MKYNCLFTKVWLNNKETNNVKALKGKLEFAGHIQKILIHKERFIPHIKSMKRPFSSSGFRQALCIIEQFSKGNIVKCKSVQLDFLK
jgi:5-methylcytosine-specific restriction enzyme subunit McrC